MQQPRLEIAEHLLDAMEDVMCRQIDKHCQPNSKVMGVLITPDMSDAEAEELVLYDQYDAENYLAEHGCTICRMGQGKFQLTDCETGHTAAGCNIDFLECVNAGGKRIGTFHTHPVGLPIPSHPDIKCCFNWKTSYDFVGGLVGGRRVIVCYMPRPTSEMKYEHLEAMCVFQSRVPIPNFPDGEPIGHIRFWREDPGPMASELLEDFEAHFPLDYYDEETRHEFKEDLKMGIIPDEYWDGYESEGTEDELAIFSDEDQRIGFDEQLDVLSSVFDVLVRWC
jgi:proteasome lid subunit RPN8/RPN11